MQNVDNDSPTYTYMWLLSNWVCVFLLMLAIHEMELRYEAEVLNQCGLELSFTNNRVSKSSSYNNLILKVTTENNLTRYKMLATMRIQIQFTQFWVYVKICSFFFFCFNLSVLSLSLVLSNYSPNDQI